MECGICHEDYPKEEMTWSFGYYRCKRCEEHMEYNQTQSVGGTR